MELAEQVRREFGAQLPAAPVRESHADRDRRQEQTKFELETKVLPIVNEQRVANRATTPLISGGRTTRSIAACGSWLHGERRDGSTVAHKEKKKKKKAARLGVYRCTRTRWNLRSALSLNLMSHHQHSIGSEALGGSGWRLRSFGMA